MGKYSNEQWYIEGDATYLAKYGEVPHRRGFSLPEYVLFNRMENGKLGDPHMMYLDNGWSTKNEALLKRSTIASLSSTTSLVSMAGALLWDDLSYDMEDQDYLKYFEKLNQLGFKLIDQFQEDCDRDLD